MSHGHRITLPGDFPRTKEYGPQMMTAGVVGVAGLALSLIGLAVGGRDAFLGYLVAFCFWLGMPIGALCLVMSHNVAGARWNVVVRRISENIAGTMPIFIVLLIPLLFGLKQIFPWVDPHGFSREGMELLEHKKPWLNTSAFTFRALLYVSYWTVLALILRGWSVRQDTDGGARLTLNMRRLSAGGLPFLAFSVTFAAFDWLMSLHPLWVSSIFGLYIWSGMFVSSIALLCILAVRLRLGGTPLGQLIKVDHQHNLGKLLFAFTCFWAYMGYSQYMLQWAGNLPEELPWITVRSFGVWRPVGQFLVVGHFVLPFLVGLTRWVKRTPALRFYAAWILLVHYVDLYWVVMPAWHPKDYGFHWVHVTAFLGIGGIFAAAALWLLRGGFSVPVRDPYLEDSLNYVQP